MKIWYTNWEGETRIRDITPLSMRFGCSEWHKEDQWLMLALDNESGHEREFAVKDFGEEVKEIEEEW